MKVRINKTTFGSIIIGGELYGYDVIIRLNGTVEKRKKKLSKELFGTSHIISLAEAEDLYEEGARLVVIGNGQSGMAQLSPEAAAFFHGKHCDVQLMPTPEAVRCWNNAEGPVIALFHVTC